MLTGSCFWNTQDFMQSLQIRWPVPAHIGLSIVMIPSAPMVKPEAFTVFISDIFSSSGQPAKFTCVGDFFTTFLPSSAGFSQRPLEQLSLPWLWQKMQ